MYKNYDEIYDNIIHGIAYASLTYLEDKEFNPVMFVDAMPNNASLFEEGAKRKARNTQLLFSKLEFFKPSVLESIQTMNIDEFREYVELKLKDFNYIENLEVLVENNLFEFLPGSISSRLQDDQLLDISPRLMLAISQLEMTSHIKGVDLMYVPKKEAVCVLFALLEKDSNNHSLLKDFSDCLRKPINQKLLSNSDKDSLKSILKFFNDWRVRNPDTNHSNKEKQSSCSKGCCKHSSHRKYSMFNQVASGIKALLKWFKDLLLKILDAIKYSISSFSSGIKNTSKKVHA